MEYSPTLKLYTSRLYFTETRGGVLGANAMQGHNVLFDWQHGRIGFSQSNCNYDLIENERQVNFPDENGDDCVLRPPILTKTCLEGIDASICEEPQESSSNVAVMGTEIWTFVVEDPGENRESCHHVATQWSLRQNLQLDPSRIDCSLDGVCTEIRPCHASCTSIREHFNNTEKQATFVVSEGQEGATDSDCGDSSWSACDFQCKQSKVETIPLSNNEGIQCHEVHRFSRECHIDACGRADPCMVPFLVHAIIVLENEKSATFLGAEPWSSDTLEHFQRQFTDLAHSFEFSGTATRRQLFKEGDVEILSVRPWFNEDEEEWNVDVKAPLGSEDRKQESTGVQVILQVSISNPKAFELNGATNRRQLLQEVDVLWKNLTQTFRSPKPTFLCNPSDLYPLAKDAVELANGILEHPDFGTKLGESLRMFSGARVLSSWTIGTQIYDDKVNYYGPLAMSPYLLALRVLYEAALLCLVVSFISLVVQTCQKHRHLAQPILRRWVLGKPARYEMVGLQEEVKDGLGQPAIEAGNLFVDTTKKKTTTTKRRQHWSPSKSAKSGELGTTLSGRHRAPSRTISNPLS